MVKPDGSTMFEIERWFPQSGNVRMSHQRVHEPKELRRGIKTSTTDTTMNGLTPNMEMIIQRKSTADFALREDKEKREQLLAATCFENHCLDKGDKL